jgi:hypothetical protein
MASSTPSLESSDSLYLTLLHRLIEADAVEWANEGVEVTIGTMCSGTDAPIFGLEELLRVFPSLRSGDDGNQEPKFLVFKHVMSCEIERYKQAFIRNNVRPDGPIFRDITEIAAALAKMVPGDGTIIYKA